MFVSSERRRCWAINCQSPVVGLHLFVWPSAKTRHFSKQFILIVKIVEFPTNHTL